jgi:hypothetical protein
MVCFWGHEQRHRYSDFFPTRLYPFVQSVGDYDVNGTLLALACSQVSLLTLWVVNGRAALEIRSGCLMLGLAAWTGILHLFYDRGIPVSAMGALFCGQVGTLFLAAILFRRRLFPQQQPQAAQKRNMQFSIRTLLVATTLIAISIAVAPYTGIVIKNPYASGHGPWVVNQWKLVLGICCAVSALCSLQAIQGKPRQIPFRLVLAGLTSSFLVVALVWLAVVHDFFYPSFSNFRPLRWDLAMYRHLYQPWASWILIQVVIVSSVLLAFRWKRTRPKASLT